MRHVNIKSANKKIEVKMKLNKAQKITIKIVLFAMTIIVLYPPVTEKSFESNRLVAITPKGRGFLFLVPNDRKQWVRTPDKQNPYSSIYPSPQTYSIHTYSTRVDVNTRKLGFEFLAIALLGTALITLFSFKKNK